MLQIKNICKEYRTGNLIQKALDHVSLNLRDNEFVAILGPSGSGKTTLLNIIGGLDCYDTGDLIINEISTKNYKDRDWDSYRNHTIGFVFQSYNLIPHQTILANVELALTISGISKSERRKKAMKALEQVGLEKQAHKKPNQLSGGQMQRVAIARALVNNPDILLADEPTGALDSQTSVQVMELLKEVAKERLVVMVTHNPELAEKYATRIVNLKDGEIRSDTNPYIIENERYSKPKHKNMGKTSMSFLTSLSLSFNNLKTKKGRTFLTSFAGSIGIIGIALILSLSNGVNTYIKSVEEDTLSEYPLQIQSTGINISAMLMDNGKETQEEKSNNDINVTGMLTNMFSTIGSNDLEALKEYFESEQCNINKYAKTIEYNYNIYPRIYSSNTKEIRQLNPDISFSSLGISSGNTSNSIMSKMMSTDMFFQMPESTELFENQYDIKAGRLPEKYNECVVILTSRGNISDFLTYTLGLREYKELSKMIEQFSKEEDVVTPDNTDSYSYEDILNVTFKLINSSDCYEYDSEYKVWRDKSENKKYMKKIVEKGETINIVGVLQPKEGVTASMLQTGIYYPASLTNHVIEEAANSKIVKQQLKSPKVNVFTGKAFEDNEENSFDMNSLFEIDKKAMQSAFKIDESKIKVDFSNLNKSINKASLPELDLNKVLSKLNFSISNKEMQALSSNLFKGYENYMKKQHPEAGFEQISKQLSKYLQSKEVSELLKKEIENAMKENGGATITEQQMQKIVSKILKGYEEYVKQNNLVGIDTLEKYLMEYLQSNEAKKIISNHLSDIIKSQNLNQQISNIMGEYMKNVMTSMSKTMEKEIMASMQNLSKSMSRAFSFDTKAFAGAIKMKMDEEELSELMTSLMSKNKVLMKEILKN